VAVRTLDDAGERVPIPEAPETGFLAVMLAARCNWRS
jgi:hypothetical protein